MGLPSGGRVVNGSTRLGLRAVVAPDDIAMKIVSAGVRGPLIADEGGETARLVRLIRRLDRLAPGAAIGGRARGREAFRHLALAEAGDDIDGGLRAFAGIDLVVPFPSLRRRQQGRIAADQLREKAHAVRVVCHHQEIQRSRKLGTLPAGSDDLLALGETISVLRAEPRAKRARVHRIRGVQCACRRSTAVSGNCAPRRASKAAWRETPSRPSPCRACRCRWLGLCASTGAGKEAHGEYSGKRRPGRGYIDAAPRSRQIIVVSSLSSGSPDEQLSNLGLASANQIVIGRSRSLVCVSAKTLTQRGGNLLG